MRKLMAEILGTFALVFAGTGAIVINDVSGGQITHLGIALTFGLIVFAMTHAVGDVSGAHLNPAVTLGLFVARKFAGRNVIPYVISQCVGALLASLFLRFLFPDHATLGATIPSGTSLQSFVLEVFLTWLLMFVALSFSVCPKDRAQWAGVVMGAVVALEALFAGPICGASMNPARSLGPAVVSLRLDNLWIYLIAPPIGALLAIIGCRCVNEPGCCCAPTTGKSAHPPVAL